MQANSSSQIGIFLHLKYVKYDIVMCLKYVIKTRVCQTTNLGPVTQTFTINGNVQLIFTQSHGTLNFDWF